MTSKRDRYVHFMVAMRKAGLEYTEAWLLYHTAGGKEDLLAIAAFLHGFDGLAAREQNILAQVINEELEIVFEAARVPPLDAEDEEERSA